MGARASPPATIVRNYATTALPFQKVWQTFGGSDYYAYLCTDNLRNVKKMPLNNLRNVKFVKFVFLRNVKRLLWHKG